MRSILFLRIDQNEALSDEIQLGINPNPTDMHWDSTAFHPDPKWGPFEFLEKYPKSVKSQQESIAAGADPLDCHWDSAR